MKRVGDKMKPDSVREWISIYSGEVFFAACAGVLLVLGIISSFCK